MNSVYHINSYFINLLSPLIEWRVLDLKSLMQEVEFHQSYHNFCRIIRVLENKKIIETYRDPYTRKKYVYISSQGENEFQLLQKHQLSKETLVHDIKVTEIARQFIDFGYVKEATLEHYLTHKQDKFSDSGIIPDAVFKGEKNGASFNIAFELELSRKKSDRLLTKLRSYLQQKNYKYIMYFITSESLLLKYYDYFTIELGQEFKDRVFFFSSKNISTKTIDIRRVRGKFRNKEQTIHEVFTT